MASGFISVIAAALTGLFPNMNPVTERIVLTDAPPPIQVIRSLPSRSFGDIVSVEEPRPAVMGVTTVTAPELPVTAAPATPTPSPKPTPIPRKTPKNRYTIALLGDSMIDTLGPGVPHLKSELLHEFPDTQFTILNYGAGGTNIDYGIQRITGGYTYLGNDIPSLASRQPDIVVIESFGYNPFPQAEGALERHWLAMAKAADTVRASVPQARIVFAVTIAPNARVFGDGAPGLSFSPEDKLTRVALIKQYLENTLRFAHDQKYPLADAYHDSLDGTGNGRTEFINGGDHIHYSDAGRRLFARKVARTIISSGLLE